MTQDLQSVEEALRRGEYPVELLNAFMPENFGWNRRDARKDHVDEFGDTVKRGEAYFHRQVGGGFHEVSKLSCRSMERVLRAVFEGNNAGLGLAKHFIKQNDDRYRSIFTRMD